MRGDYLQTYPHKSVEYVIVVPNRKAATSVLLMSVVRSPLISVWLNVIVVVTLLRIVFQKRALKNRTSKKRNWSELFFDSVGRAFGTSTIAKIEDLSERVLLLGMSFFALLAGIICSGMLFEKFSSNQYSQIVSSIDDLKGSGYIFMVPNRFTLSITHFQER